MNMAIYTLIDEISRALARNPEAECRYPPYAVIEGEW
jgi:hypothetical protein